jgi:signal transduction histidine kinase
VECSLSPIVSGADEVTHFVGIAIDVTARVAAEEANAKRRAQLDAIFSLSPDGFVLFDANEQLVFANPAFERLTGGFLLSTDVGMDLRGFESGLLGLCGPEQTPVTFEFKPQEVRDTEEWQARLHLVRPQTRVLQAQARRTAQGRGETIFYFRDVTHEDAVDRMKSEFLAAAAHELRTPMVSIFGFTELLLRRKFTPERQADMLQTIHRQSGLLVKMINELLDLARIESRRGLDLQIEPHPLRELVEHSVKGLMLKDTDRQVIVRDVPPAVVLIDPEKMQLAMNNLLSNAFKYSPKGGDVAVAAFIDVLDGTHYAVIEVTDQGLGMSPEQLARAFDRFYRADASGNIPGTGLGLSMVREVASLHHGQIELDSVLGQGTTARLWIPLDAHHPSTHGIAASPPKESLGEVSILA